MSYFECFNGDNMHFPNLQNAVDIIKLRECDKDFCENIKLLSIFNEYNNITLDNNFFDNLVNLEYFYCNFSNVTLAKNSLCKLYKLKRFNFLRQLPNLKYLGIPNTDSLEYLSIVTPIVDEHFFCDNSFGRLKTVVIGAANFVGDCFKNLPNLTYVIINVFDSYVCANFFNFKLHSQRLKEFIISSSNVTANKCNIYIPSARYVHVCDTNICHDILLNSHRVYSVTCENNDFHVSSLFDKSELSDAQFIGTDLCEENVCEFKKFKRLKKVNIKNKKITHRDLPNDIINKIHLT